MIWLLGGLAVLYLLTRPSRTVVFHEHRSILDYEAEKTLRERREQESRLQEAREKAKERNRRKRAIAGNLPETLKLIGWVRNEYRREWITSCGAILSDIDMYFSFWQYVDLAYDIIENRNHAAKRSL